VGSCWLTLGAVQLNFDKLSSHKNKELRQFLKERGVDSTKFAGGEKTELVQLVRESRHLPIIVPYEEPVAKDASHGDIKTLIEKMRKESGMNFKVMTPEDIEKEMKEKEDL